MTVTDIARVCHEAVRAYHAAVDPRPFEAWDDLQRPFQRATETVVRHYLANPTHTFRARHEERCRLMVDEFWRAFTSGDVPGNVSPDMVPYYSLPANLRVTHRLYESTIDALRPLLGM